MNVNVITYENCKITFKPCHAVLQKPCECGLEFEMQYECAGDYIPKKSQAILVVQHFSIPQSDVAVQVLNMA